APLYNPYSMPAAPLAPVAQALAPPAYTAAAIPPVAATAPAAVPGVGLAASLAAARQADAAMLKRYSWTCRTELIHSGSVMDTRIESVVYGQDGQLQRTLLNDKAAPLPWGFIRKAIEESKRKDLEKYVVGLRTSLDQYSLPTASGMTSFVAQS